MSLWTLFHGQKTVEFVWKRNNTNISASIVSASCVQTQSPISSFFSFFLHLDQWSVTPSCQSTCQEKKIPVFTSVARFTFGKCAQKHKMQKNGSLWKSLHTRKYLAPCNLCSSTPWLSLLPALRSCFWGNVTLVREFACRDKEIIKPWRPPLPSSLAVDGNFLDKRQWRRPPEQIQCESRNGGQIYDTTTFSLCIQCTHRILQSSVRLTPRCLVFALFQSVSQRPGVKNINLVAEFAKGMARFILILMKSKSKTSELNTFHK